ncbi:hypothetical protein GJ688_13025 [Heliobacillus mobilis]|uniref:Lysine-N-methylase n=1 Tax=Heliobacterium mobile TaxID=28064 RepID=A0A6I3SMA0_HELMO|nr:flagellin lysine-N-methylase [Heliobacterium mobile]MTV49896.1 hypothetical protein [Heliobacterium mobile]
MKQSRKVYVPWYLRSFQCAGAECQDACCGLGKALNIDQKTYKKYRKVQDPSFRKEIDRKIQRIRSGATDDAYALVTPSESGNCPFWNRDRICSIHKKLGEDALPGWCASYPRITNIINGRWERTGTLACPAVARRALLNKGPLVLTEIDEPNLPFRGVYGQLNVSHTSEPELWAGYIERTRQFVFSCLQSRGYSVDDRMLLLGFFCESLARVLPDDRAKKLPAIVEDMDSFLMEPKTLKINYHLPKRDRRNLQRDLLDTLSEFNQQNRFYQGFSQLLTQSFCGLDAGSNAKTKRDKAYYDAEGTYYHPLIQEHEYILENFLVNRVYNMVFPFMTPNPFDQYITLCLTFMLVKNLLVGLAAFHKEHIQVEHMVELIQTLTREEERNSSWLMNLKQKVIEGQNDNMAAMAMLIKC